MKVGDLVRIKTVKGKPMGIIIDNPKPSRVRGGRLSCDVYMLESGKVDGWAVTAIEVIG